MIFWVTGAQRVKRRRTNPTRRTLIDSPMTMIASLIPDIYSSSLPASSSSTLLVEGGKDFSRSRGWVSWLGEGGAGLTENLDSDILINLIGEESKLRKLERVNEGGGV